VLSRDNAEESGPDETLKLGGVKMGGGGQTGLVRATSINIIFLMLPTLKTSA
jgi:hypothetical protein